MMKKGKESKGKSFAVYFGISFVIFLAASMGIGTLVHKTGEIQLFGETEENLMDDLEFLVDADSEFYEAFQDKNRINILLLGVNDGLTDTIMVGSFDTDARHLDLISVPRDTYYHRDGYEGAAERKINAAYRGHAINTARAVSEILLGMPLHYYVIVDYEGIEKIVDSMGGVPMYIEFPMKYSDPTDKPPLYINIPAGEQVLDGEHAVQFLRYRKGYSEGDIGRVKAQQEFMKAAFRQMLGFELPKVAKTIFKNVESDITLDMTLKMAAKAAGMDADSMETYLMPATYENEAPWYVYPDNAGIEEMIRTIYSIEAPAEEGTDAKE